VKEGLTRNCFYAAILEFQSYSRHRNYFDIDSKQTHSEEIQVIPMERFSDVMKKFFVLLLTKM
jgi:maltooligosyltrehalose synthase